jgi:hypothetical protein
MSHVELSPSSASRWLACPGSIALSRHIPEPPSSAAAEEGTRAHALAEHWLTHGTPPDGAEAEMRDYVQHFVDFCRALQQSGTVHAIEQRLTMDRLNPPAPMAGTADFLCLSAERLDIVDLKYGQGVYVNEQDNPQLLYYAVMGMLWCEAHAMPVPPEVRITIVQPRMEYLGDIIRSVSYSLDELLGFLHTLLDGARATQQPDAPLVVGKHCRWCKALTICPAQRQNAIEVAQMDFDVVTPQALPAPTLLTNEELGGILARATWLGQWVDALRKEAQERLEKNGVIPGWKLVPKQPRRKWKASVPEVLDAIAPYGLTLNDVTEVKLKGIGEVEKLLNKSKKGAKLPATLTDSESSGFNLAPESDRRADRAEIAAAEFSVVSSITSQE